MLILLGVVGSFLANVLYKFYEKSQSATRTLEERITSSDPIERQHAIALCLFNAGKWYLVGNLFWVVAGAAWTLDGVIRDAESGWLFIRSVLGITSFIAIFYFWLALLWAARAYRGYNSPK